VGSGLDGPSHFLASRAPTGATLLNRLHLELLDHTLVSVPYWEWDRFKGPGEREQYLRGKLRQCIKRWRQARILRLNSTSVSTCLQQCL
jgi:hypothetical protein